MTPSFLMNPDNVVASYFIIFLGLDRNYAWIIH